MRKCITVLFMCMVVFFTSVTPTFANDRSISDSAVTPYMSYINQAWADLSVDNYGVAYVECRAAGVSGTTIRMEISAKLQKYVNGTWVTLTTFTASSNSASVSLKESYCVTKGAKYRVVASVRAYTASSSEGQTVYSASVS